MWSFSEEGQKYFSLLILYVYILKDFMWKVGWQWIILKCVINFFCAWTLMNELVRIIFHLDHSSEP